MKTNRIKSKKADHSSKIDEALALLSEAAEEKQHELQESIRHHYETLHHNVDEVVSNGKHILEEVQEKAGAAIHEGEKKIKEKTEEVNEKVHENPWPVIGLVGLGAFLLGYTAKSKQVRRRIQKSTKS